MAWFDPAWSYRVPVTIVGSEIPGSTLNFELLLTESNFPASLFTNANVDGSDLVITDSDEVTKLPRDLLEYIPGSSRFTLRTMLSGGLSVGVDKLIYVYYGNAASQESNDSAAYRAAMIGYWTLNEDPESVAPQFKDRSSYGRDGTSLGLTTAINQTIGLHGPAFVGSSRDAAITFPDIPEFNSATQISWLSITEIDAAATLFYIYAKGGRADTDSFYIYGTNTYQQYLESTNQVGTPFAQPIAARNTWLTIGHKFDGQLPDPKQRWFAGGDGSLFYPASSVVDAAGGLPIITKGYRIGSLEGGFSGHWYEGKLQHCRVYAEALSDGYYATTYANEININTFYSVGSEEGQTGGRVQTRGFANMDLNFTNMRG